MAWTYTRASVTTDAASVTVTITDPATGRSETRTYTRMAGETRVQMRARVRREVGAIISECNAAVTTEDATTEFTP